eukprot:COSAG02_NODE_4718_length_5059_cov_6.717540_5_plen_91_part_00
MSHTPGTVGNETLVGATLSAVRPLVWAARARRQRVPAMPIIVACVLQYRGSWLHRASRGASSAFRVRRSVVPDCMRPASGREGACEICTA